MLRSLVIRSHQPRLSPLSRLFLAYFASSLVYRDDLFCFDTLPNSLALLKTLSPAFSSDSALFVQNTGVAPLAALRRRPALHFLHPALRLHFFALFCRHQNAKFHLFHRSPHKNTRVGVQLQNASPFRPHLPTSFFVTQLRLQLQSTQPLPHSFRHHRGGVSTATSRPYFLTSLPHCFRLFATLLRRNHQPIDRELHA